MFQHISLKIYGTNVTRKWVEEVLSSHVVLAGTLYDTAMDHPLDNSLTMQSWMVHQDQQKDQQKVFLSLPFFQGAALKGKLVEIPTITVILDCIFFFF